MEDTKTVTTYVEWKEVFVSREKGKREVRYYLKRVDGKEDLVIVGKEGLGCMSYRYVMKGLSNGGVKLSCRRDVLDCVQSLISGNQPSSHEQFVVNMGCNSDACGNEHLGRCKDDFRWLGSPWACRKKRLHYRSFYRNGVVISVQNFVCVLAEEGKRLVAHLDDLHEDCRGNKMAVVRWFHKIDEVGFILHHSRNDREIFFSLCLQDLSIECIDGLATILSPHHYEKYLSEGTRMGLTPFMCCRLFDTDELKPLDITTVEGYWNQEILQKAASLISESSDDDLIGKGSLAKADTVIPRPKKRIRLSMGCDPYPNSMDENVSPTDTKEGIVVDCRHKESCSPFSNLTQCLTIGSQVEVLCQDSGIRGCWFRGLIVEKIKNKVKVRYQDLRDTSDREIYLEEWFSAFRLAAPDPLGIHIPERTMVRPSPPSDKVKVCGVNVGSVVDAWWCDGWWEGIVVKKESEVKFIVYFPGEKQVIVFNIGDLRHSLEWVDNGWQCVKARLELVPTLLSGLTKAKKIIADSNRRERGCVFSNGGKDCISRESPNSVIKICIYANHGMPKQPLIFGDLSKDDLLLRSGWKSKKKRSRISSRPIVSQETRSSAKKFDAGNCEYSIDPHLSSSPVTPLTCFDISL